MRSPLPRGAPRPARGGRAGPGPYPRPLPRSWVFLFWFAVVFFFLCRSAGDGGPRAGIPAEPSRAGLGRTEPRRAGRAAAPAALWNGAAAAGRAPSLPGAGSARGSAARSLCFPVLPSLSVNLFIYLFFLEFLTFLLYFFFPLPAASGARSRLGDPAPAPPLASPAARPAAVGTLLPFCSYFFPPPPSRHVSCVLKPISSRSLPSFR